MRQDYQRHEIAGDNPTEIEGSTLDWLACKTLLDCRLVLLPD